MTRPKKNKIIAPLMFCRCGNIGLFVRDAPERPRGYEPYGAWEFHRWDRSPVLRCIRCGREDAKHARPEDVAALMEPTDYVRCRKSMLPSALPYDTEMRKLMRDNPRHEQVSLILSAMAGQKPFLTSTARHYHLPIPAGYVERGLRMVWESVSPKKKKLRTKRLMKCDCLWVGSDLKLIRERRGGGIHGKVSYTYRCPACESAWVRHTRPEYVAALMTPPDFEKYLPAMLPTLLPGPDDSCLCRFKGEEPEVQQLVLVLRALSLRRPVRITTLKHFNLRVPNGYVTDGPNIICVCPGQWPTSVEREK